MYKSKHSFNPSIMPTINNATMATKYALTANMLNTMSLITYPAKTM